MSRLPLSLLTQWATLWVVLCSCSSASVIQKLDPKKNYRMDMIIEVNGISKEGFLVLPEANKYKFKIETRGKINLFSYKSCHREWTKESAWDVKKKKKFFFGWLQRRLSNKKVISFDIELTKLEKGPGCPVYLAAYERKKGRHSWGMVDFQNKKETLVAVIRCNGNNIVGTGVSICQSRIGLIQQIEFETAVSISPDPGCAPMKEVDAKTYTWEMGAKDCQYIFLELDEKDRKHRLTTHGYDSILIREPK